MPSAATRSATCSGRVAAGARAGGPRVVGRGRPPGGTLTSPGDSFRPALFAEWCRSGCQTQRLRAAGTSRFSTAAGARVSRCRPIPLENAGFTAPEGTGPVHPSIPAGPASNRSATFGTFHPSRPRGYATGPLIASPFASATALRVVRLCALTSHLAGGAHSGPRDLPEFRSEVHPRFRPDMNPEPRRRLRSQDVDPPGQLLTRRTAKSQ